MLQNLMKLMRKDQKGFTLVELMIVVVIIGILIAIAIPVYRSIQDNAETRACQANQRNILSMLQVYKADADTTITGASKDETTWNTEALTAFLNSDYFESAPLCPSGDRNPYEWNSASGGLYCPNDVDHVL